MNLEIIMQEILNDSGKLIFLVLLSVIVIDAIIGVFLLLRTQKFMANSIVTKAKTLGLKNNYFEIEYHDRLGKKLNDQLYYPVKNLKEGDDIEIRYDKDNPSKMKRNNKFQIFIIPLALLESTFLFIFLLIYLVYSGVAKFPF